MQELKFKLLFLKDFIDNEYLDKYCELIISNLETEKEQYKTEKHHIVPQCYYRLNKLKINNFKENIVYLGYIDHIWAHYYLALCTEKDLKYRLSIAFSHLTGNKKFLEKENFNPEIDLPKYKEIKEEHSKGMSEYWKNVSEEDKLKFKEKRRETYKKLGEDYQKEIALKRSESFKNMSEEDRKERGEKLSKSQKLFYEKLTEEEKEERREYQANVVNKFWESLSEEEYLNRCKKLAERYEKLPIEEQEKVSKEMTSRMLNYWNSLTPEQRAERGKQRSIYYQNLTEEEKERDKQKQLNGIKNMSLEDWIERAKKESKAFANRSLEEKEMSINKRFKTLGIESVKNTINRISKEEIYQYFIVENHTRVETCNYYNLSKYRLNELLKHYGILKDNNKETNIKKSGRKITAPMKVRCVETGEEFNSIFEAADRYSINYKRIRDSIKKDIRVYGFHWEEIK